MNEYQFSVLQDYIDNIGAIIEADAEGEVFTCADVDLHLKAEEVLNDIYNGSV